MLAFLDLARDLVPDAMKIREELPYFQFGPRPSTSVQNERDRGKPAQIIDNRHILYYGEVESRIDALGETFYY